MEIADYLHDGRNARSTAFGPMAQVIDGATRHLTDQDLRAARRAAIR